MAQPAMALPSMAQPSAALPDDDEPMRFSALSPDIVAEISFRVKDLRSLRSVLRFDLFAVASVKIQRMIRHVRDGKFSPRAHDIAVERLSSSCYSSATPEESISAIARAHEQVLLATQRAADGMSDAAADAAAAVDLMEKVASAKAAATDLLPLDVTDQAYPKPGELDDIDSLVRDGAHAVLWCWLPRSSCWTLYELLERCSRAVAACRGDDMIALPDLPLARELAEHWHVTDYGPDRLRAENVIWFDAQLPPAEACDDPSFATLTRVLEQYHLRRCSLAATTQMALYCMYPDARIASLATSYGLRCLGDLAEHPIVGPLAQAKSFLHRSLNDARRPSLCDAALDTARGPRGFCCTTSEQLLDAWERLATADPNMPLVLKPASGSGGKGVILNAKRADVEAVAAKMLCHRQGRFLVKSVGVGETCDDETIIEEMVGACGQPSPTVYVVGSRVAVVADQLLSRCGTISLGNVSPATQVDPSIIDAMSRACLELGKFLGLVGQWGVDFAIDQHGTPIMVDLNMGRPNGSLSYYCWRARQPGSGAGANGGRPQRALALVASAFTLPAGLPLGPFATALQAEGLLWDTKRGSGIILAQHLPGFDSGGSVLAASWEGVDAAQHMLEAFQAHLVRLA